MTFVALCFENRTKHRATRPDFSGVSPREMTARATNLGDQVPTWFDGNCCRFLHLEYARIVGRVRLGHSDEQILQWAYETGKRPTQEEIMVWNSFMAKRGWRDQATASLNRWKAELGFRDRNDIQTFFDLYDADEGREISSTDPPDL